LQTVYINQVKQAAFKILIDTDTAPNSADSDIVAEEFFSCVFIDKHRHPNSRRFGFHHRQSKNAASTDYRQDSAIDDILNGKYLNLTVIA